MAMDPTLFQSLVKYSVSKLFLPLGMDSTFDALLVNKLPSPSQGAIPFCHSKTSMSGPNIQLSPNHKLSNVDIVNRLTCPQMRNRPVVLKLDLKVLKCAPRLKMQCTGIVLYLQFCPKMQSAVLPCEATAVL